MIIALTPRFETQVTVVNCLALHALEPVFSDSSAIIQVCVVSIEAFIQIGYIVSIVVDILSKLTLKPADEFITCVMQIDKYESVYTIHLSTGLFTLVLRRIANIIQVCSIDN